MLLWSKRRVSRLPACRLHLFVTLACVLAGLPLIFPGTLLAWQGDNGNADDTPGVTIQQPTLGVMVDANGIMQAHVFPDPTGQLTELRRQAAVRKLSAEVQQPSALRTISLQRLEAAIQRRLDQGLPLDEEMKYLAGLQRAQFVFISPNDGDILIAGPAEGWLEDLSGRAVGIDSGRPRPCCSRTWSRC